MADLLAKIGDLLKASGWQTAMIAFAAGLFLYLSKTGVLPAMEPDIELIPWAVFFFSLSLALASIAAIIQKASSSGWARIQHKRARRSSAETFRKHIPYLTDRERQILGYLLKKKQKTFVAHDDGGYANTLIAQGFVRYIGVPGQPYDLDKTPMGIPEHLWEVMEQNCEDLPYNPSYSSENPKVEVEPWHIPWQLR